MDQAQNMSEKERRFVDHWKTISEPVAEIKTALQSGGDLVRLLEYLEGSMKGFFVVSRGGTFITGTSIPVDGINDSRDQILATLSGAFAQLKEFSPAADSFIQQNVLSILILSNSSTEPVASIDPDRPGEIKVGPGFLTNSSVWLIIPMLLEEAAHSQFLMEWPLNRVMTRNYKFEDVHAYASPLTKSSDAYSYLIEADGKNLAKAILMRELSAYLPLSLRNTLVFDAGFFLRNAAATLEPLRAPHFPSDVLTPEGHLLVASLRKKASALKDKLGLKIPFDGLLADSSEEIGRGWETMITASTGTLDKSGLEETADTLLTPEVESQLAVQGFAGLDQGRILLDPAKLTLAPTRVFLHSGLEEPRGLENMAAVIPMKAGSTVEALRFFKERGVNGRDVIFANLGILSPTEIAASLPLVDPLPGVVGLPEGTQLTASEAIALAELSKRVGPIYIINISRIISRKGETLLLLQAA